MKVLNNTPRAGYIQWSDVSISYKGTVYNIANGSTDLIYIYWKFSDPLPFYGSDVFPSLGDDDLMVFLNKNGVHVKVPTATVLDGSLIVPESILADAISANSISTDHLQSNSVSSDNIVANAIGTDKIAANAVIGEKIMAGSIETKHIVTEGLDVSRIKGAVTDKTFNALETRVSVTEGKFASYVTLTNYNADIKGTGGALARLSQAETKIDQNVNDIKLRATKSELDTRMGDVVDRLDDAEAELLIQSNAISQRVTTTTYNALAGRVSTAEGKITTNAGQIALKASQSDLDSAKKRLDTAEATLTVLPGQISSKVEKNGVISSINQTSEQLKISVAKVSIDGDLEVVNGLVKLKQLIVDTVNIKKGAVTKDLFATNAVIDNVNAGTAKIDFAKIGNVQITNAMITGGLDAGKITTGRLESIDIVGVNIQGSNFSSRYDDPSAGEGWMTLDDGGLAFNSEYDIGGATGLFTSHTSYGPHTIRFEATRSGIYNHNFELNRYGMEFMFQGGGTDPRMSFSLTAEQDSIYSKLWSEGGIKLHSEYANGIRIQTPTGYADFGARNTSYFHIDTDRASGFYMYKSLSVDALRARGTATLTSDAHVTSAIRLYDGLTTSRYGVFETETASNRQAVMIRADRNISNGASLNMYGDSDATYPGEAKFWVGGTLRMTLLPNGNVGIGVGSPSEKLHVSGGSVLSQAFISTATEGFVGRGTGTTRFSSELGAASLVSGGTSLIYLTPAGDEVRVTAPGTTTSYKPIRASSHPTGSSAKWKANIREITEEQVNYVLDTTPVFTYHLQNELDSGIYDKPKVGMLSEGVAQLLRDEDGVNPYSIASTAFAGVKLLKRKLAEQDKRIADLELIVREIA